MDFENLKFIYLSHKGRISRMTYWLYSLFLLPIFLIIDFYETQINTIIYLILLIILTYPAMMINIKRCHDRNRSGFFSLLLLLPIISIWPLIELGFIKGTEGGNKYGPYNT